MTNLKDFNKTLHFIAKSLLSIVCLCVYREEETEVLWGQEVQTDIKTLQYVCVPVGPFMEGSLHGHVPHKRTLSF